MQTTLIVLGAAGLLAIIWFKVIRWHWLRDPVEDRWLAARAIEELLHPADYWGDVEEFSSIPIRNDETLKNLQTTINQLFEDPMNFVEPPSIKNEYPNLSDTGRNRIIEIGRVLEKELPNYSLNSDAQKRRAG